VWGVDDVEGCDGEGEGSGFDAATDDDLSFFGEAGCRFVGGRELGREDLLEYCSFGVVRFGRYTGESAGDEGALVLGIVRSSGICWRETG
jgi:hypothetical protein